MRRLPLPLVFAIAIVATAVVYITITSETADVYVIDVGQLNVTTAVNITLPGLPAVLLLQNLTTKNVCVYIYTPGGVFLDKVYGDYYIEYIELGCYYSYSRYPSRNMWIYFNGTIPPGTHWNSTFAVVKPPKYVKITFFNPYSGWTPTYGE